MKKLARFIVKNRLWLFFVFIAIAAYCVYGVTRIEVEYDIAEYLPDDTDTSRAIEIMANEFEDSGSATFVVKNIDKGAATALAVQIKGIDGVASVTFDAESPSYYNSEKSCAQYSVLYVGGSSNARARAAYDKTTALLGGSGYSYTVPTPLVNSYADVLSSEMTVIIAIAAAVIIAVLLFTSKSFAEVLAFPAVFVIAALLNMGTNYWLGKISFVSNTVCIILQLALAIDYAIILCHRFTEEKERRRGSAEDAMSRALECAIPEIASSSLTTVSGLVALMFMQLGLGFDLGMVLAKSIVCSLLTVFFFMPCILMWLTKLMDKTRHRNLVPKMRFLGTGVIKARYFILAAFAALFACGAWASGNITYCYSQNSIDTSRPTETVRAERERDELFGASNAFVILVPKDVDPDARRALVNAVQSEELITSALDWSTIALPSRTDESKSYYLTDRINCAELTDIAGVSDDAARLVFMLYASSRGEAGEIADITEYRAEAGELFLFVFSNPMLSGAAGEGLAQYGDLLKTAKTQLVGTSHYRAVFNINASVESKSTFSLIERLMPEIKFICPRAVFAGQSMSAYDLNGSFKTDNILITVLTIAFIFVILSITFRSWGIPIALVAIIQGAIFMNFSLPVIAGSNLFFFVYLIASAIQMGATIDYAIILTNRFLQTKRDHARAEALKAAISASFPTIMTSGTIMSIAAFLVGSLTSDPLISSMGMTLGTGTLISILCVLTVLPALLYVIAPVIDKTFVHIGRKKKPADAENVSAENDNAQSVESIDGGGAENFGAQKAGNESANDQTKNNDNNENNISEET